MTRPIDEIPTAPPAPQPPFTFAVAIRTQGRRPSSLNEAVDSVLAQTLTADEIIVMAHGSDDVADSIRSSLGARANAANLQLQVISGGGRSVPLNAAIDQATSDYLCFLDDDDLVTEDWLESFAAGAGTAPGTIIRAVTLSQTWTSDGREEPVRATAEPTRPFPVEFDLLAHMSLNQTPICSLAYPLAGIRTLGLRFDHDLPVYEDWDFLMRAAMPLGVTSIGNETSLYRRLDSGNADTAADVATWERAHAAVIDKLSVAPVILPAGDARRLAGTHFQLGARSRHETELEAANAEISRLTKSPWAGPLAFARRASGVVRRRTSAQRP